LQGRDRRAVDAAELREAVNYGDNDENGSDDNDGKTVGIAMA
jgi:hypothetical protein